MLPITMTITSAGLDALVDAQAGDTDPIEVTEVGLSSLEVDPAPTIVALPGEFKRIDAISGAVVAPNIIHMTAQDASTDIYDLRSIALYLADGTLFAIYGQADPLFSKVSIASFLFALDLVFSSDIAGAIEFGDATFLYPPATETEKGVAEIATQAEVDAEVDDTRIVTPLKLGVRLAALLGVIDDALADEIAARIAGDNALQALITALQAITVTGGGLATGGGNLTANRVLTVLKASGAESLARTLDDRAVTPLGLASLLPAATPTMVQIGTVMIQLGTGTLGGNSTGSVTFPVAYASWCKFIANGQNSDWSQEGSVGHYANTLSGGSIANSAAASAPYTWLAIGE